MAKAKVKRIFITGSPGAMWSSTDRVLRAGFAPYTDNSDVNKNRNWHGHQGAYWNPGNEPGYDWVLNFDKYSREEIENMLDSAYADEVPDESEIPYIVRTHKSHYWSYFFDHIEKLFPECDILTTRQEPHKSWIWWQVCDGHDIVHDAYDFYKRDWGEVWNEVATQCKNIDAWINKHNLKLQYLNVDFFREHFGEPSTLLIEQNAGRIRHPDGIDSFCGQASMGRNLGNSCYVTIKYGTPRQFNVEKKDEN
jgi:hypothetical protein